MSQDSGAEGLLEKRLCKGAAKLAQGGVAGLTRGAAAHHSDPDEEMPAEDNTACLFILFICLFYFILFWLRLGHGNVQTRC